ncbi:hypothetical protein WR25_10056 [Diploscapter pachys]|uniref:Uncharacterized protein n=1 Tax=Diploscapter pachys TaxID=2018661 RepID=A0A2A2JAM4_9BILA|nr:hypothetical protein WR25_10056 [Diploscapter pachys]
MKFCMLKDTPETSIPAIQVESCISPRILRTSTLKVVLSHVEVVTVVEQSLGGNATHVQTCAAESLALLHANGFHAELGCFDRCHITPRAASEHDQVCICKAITQSVILVTRHSAQGRL